MCLICRMVKYVKRYRCIGTGVVVLLCNDCT